VTGPWASAAEIARAVSAGGTTALAVTAAALARIAAANPALNAFTEVTAERALAEAAAVDATCTAGRAPGPLAGVPYAVKNLFDVEGLATRAGSLINRERAAAERDATLVRRPSLGVLTQPLSCIGLPVATVPIFEPGQPPIGVQLGAAPWSEDLCLRAAYCLESAGTAVAHPPTRT
jgi:Asp-tRNA(Asn)/Glu-tRNA(Gln) amidotransferase A subunit family amidase